MSNSSLGYAQAFVKCDMPAKVGKNFIVSSVLFLLLGFFSKEICCMC